MRRNVYSQANLFRSKSQVKKSPFHVFAIFKTVEAWKLYRDKVVTAIEDKTPADYKLSARIKNCKEKVLEYHCKEHSTSQRFPTTCKSWVCPVCSLTSYNLYLKKFLPHFKNTEKPAGYKWQFVTLTKRHTGKKFLDRQFLTDFYKAVRKVVNRFYPAKAKAGALAVFEFGANMNPHVHLLALGPVPSQSALSQALWKATGDSYKVDIRDEATIRAKYGYSFNTADLLRYILKYIKKPLFLESYQNAADLLVTLKKFRRVHTYGRFYNLKFILAKKGTPLCPVCNFPMTFLKVSTEPWWDEATLKKFLKIKDFP